MKLYFRVLFAKTRDCESATSAPALLSLPLPLPCVSEFKRMLMIANDSGEMAVVVESNGILYEAIIDPLF